MNSDTALTIGSIVRSFDFERFTFVVMATFPDGTYGGEIMYDGATRVVVRRGFVYDEGWEPIEEPCDCDYCEGSWKAMAAEWEARHKE